MRLSTAATVLALGGSVLAAEPSLTSRSSGTKTKRALPAISVVGNAFFADGKRFYVRGIDYQPGGAAKNEDPLANTAVCKRDIAEFKELGVNAVRVYSLDSTLDHDECMELLADAGIYLMADVNSPNYSINREHPAPSYNTEYLQAVFSIVDEFAKYDHTMLFFSGNEVINDENTTHTAPYVKATTRDIKSYMRSRNLRTIPVGYSAADVSENRQQTADYFNCGDDDVRSDFFAFNDYSWCNTDFLTAGWNQKVRNFTDYGIPIFLSEFGCITNGERRFGEIESLMHPNMTSVYSGGMMYEYTSEENNYGIVTVKDDDSNVEKSPEFANLASAFSRWPAPTGDGSPQHTTTKSVACPTRDAQWWDVDPESLPILPQQAESLMDNGAGEGPGLEGSGSQSGDGTALRWTGADPNSNDTDSDSGSGNGNGGSQNSDDNDSAAPGQHFEVGAVAVTGMALLFTLGGALLL
ncbi:1,3-beta-glucanosyltransferase gel1 [Plectosphaerella plurivora]|uniref:1,3-beta-glucanosyltransferase n=1 Tax=Plectosphaerella plurivora TaxID=936078 RepID=A0A9P8VLN5_9PEZI|nr:1,3-beta-glucanosyltransferase gel1 [Plectosphaerella plurivora]